MSNLKAISGKGLEMYYLIVVLLMVTIAAWILEDRWSNGKKKDGDGE
ncbi:MAG: hypothetical protein ACO1OF_11730 [Adhaeribacter sp.]